MKIDLHEIQPATLRDIAQMLAADGIIDDLLQIALGVLSLAAIVMIATTGPLHRWGFVVGLASQPFWIIASWRSRAPNGRRPWGIILLSWCYLFVWILGIGERFS